MSEIAPAPLTLTDNEVTLICARIRSEVIDMEAARRNLKRRRVPRGERALGDGPRVSQKVQSEILKLAKKMGLLKSDVV